MGQVILDFIKTNYFVVVYGITWFISVFTYRKYFDTLLKYFPIIIAYTFFSELLGSLVGQNENIQLVFGYEQKNLQYIVYNIYYPCFFLFFFYIYWKSSSDKKQKNIIKYGSFLFIIVNFLNLIAENPLTSSSKYAYIFGTIHLIYCTLSYFSRVFKENRFSIIKYSLFFWVSLGLLIFHTTYLPLKILREFYYELYIPLRQFHLVMIVVMYVLFSTGFIISKRRAFR